MKKKIVFLALLAGIAAAVLTASKCPTAKVDQNDTTAPDVVEIRIKVDDGPYKDTLNGMGMELNQDSVVRLVCEVQDEEGLKEASFTFTSEPLKPCHVGAGEPLSNFPPSQKDTMFIDAEGKVTTKHAFLAVIGPTRCNFVKGTGQGFQSETIVTALCSATNWASKPEPIGNKPVDTRIKYVRLIVPFFNNLE